MCQVHISGFQLLHEWLSVSKLSWNMMMMVGMRIICQHLHLALELELDPAVLPVSVVPAPLVPVAQSSVPVAQSSAQVAPIAAVPPAPIPLVP